MKLFHLVLDGYSPNNDLNLFKDNFLSIDKSAYKYSNEYITKDDSQKIMISPEMWCRIYSGVQLKDIKRYDPNDKLQEEDNRSRIRRLNPNEFIWNIVSSKGLPAFVFPYYTYTGLVNHNLSNDKLNSNLYGIFRYYCRKYYSKYNRGNIYKVPSDYEYKVLYEIGDNVGRNSPEVYNKYLNLWKTDDSNDFMSDLVSYLEDYFISNYEKDINDNNHIFNDEVFNYISDIDYSNGGYLHLGLVETDTIYHFAAPYDKAHKMINEYVNDKISKVINIMNPDVIIIHGDHNMVPSDKSSVNHRYRKTVTYNDKKYECIKSMWSISPFYYDHGNNVGGKVFSKNKDVIDYFNNTYDENVLFMDQVREFIKEKIGD